MNKNQAIKALRDWDKRGRYVFTKHDLSKIFSGDNAKTLSEGLQRLVKSDVLIRACRGVYVNIHAACSDAYTIEHIAKALRPGEYNYVSLESILSEYGVISQIPVDRLTVMTTGREGVHKTSFGTIEFTHTKRSYIAIIEGIITVQNRPLRIASIEAAWRDLKRVGRNINMVNYEELYGNKQ
jgi:predicted transcriptional regulator of viral defense system